MIRSFLRKRKQQQAMARLALDVERRRNSYATIDYAKRRTAALKATRAART